jgi:hypothetical protein
MLLTPKNRLKLKKNKAKIDICAKASNKIDLTRYAGFPVEFFTSVLDVKILTEEQKQILHSINANQTTNVQAGHGLGKSFLMGGYIIYFVFAVEGMAVSTAPTFNQVNDILWKEVRNIYDRNREKLGGRRNELSIRKITSAGRIVIGFGKTSKDNSSASFQGLHEENLLLIQDEADGISNIIDEAFEACLTGSKNKGVKIGNPLNRSSAFARSCKISNIKIPVWTHPNVNWAYEQVVAENGKLVHRLKKEVAAKILKPPCAQKDDPVKPQSEWDETLPRDVIPGAVSIAWIEKMRVKYGEFSTYWISRIEAEFPGDDVEGTIPISWLIDARVRYDRNPEYWDNLASEYQWSIGVDVGDGVDSHAVSVRRGMVLYSCKKYATTGDRKDTIRLAKEIVEPLVDSLGDCLVAVDRIGVGAGTLGTLLDDGYEAKGCTFGDRALSCLEYRNRKTELTWQLRELLQSGGFAIAPLGEREEEIFEELAAPRYNVNTEKQIYLESKEETKKRLSRSPDGGESIIISLELGMTIATAISSIAASTHLPRNDF